MNNRSKSFADVNFENEFYADLCKAAFQHFSGYNPFPCKGGEYKFLLECGEADLLASAGVKEVAPIALKAVELLGLQYASYDYQEKYWRFDKCTALYKVLGATEVTLRSVLHSIKPYVNDRRYYKTLYELGL